jgi:hypothetical protein
MEDLDQLFLAAREFGVSSGPSSAPRCTDTERVGDVLDGGKERPSRSMAKAKMSPRAPQPKQRNVGGSARHAERGCLLLMEGAEPAPGPTRAGELDVARDVRDEIGASAEVVEETSENIVLAPWKEV